DVATEATIVAALRDDTGPQAPATQRASILLCSTRLAAFPLADRIVVLDHGRIVEEGRHDTLLAHGGLYARTYRAQQRPQQTTGHRGRPPPPASGCPSRNHCASWCVPGGPGSSFWPLPSSLLPSSTCSHRWSSVASSTSWPPATSPGCPRQPACTSPP